MSQPPLHPLDLAIPMNALTFVTLIGSHTTEALTAARAAFSRKLKLREARVIIDRCERNIRWLTASALLAIPRDALARRGDDDADPPSTGRGS